MAQNDVFEPLMLYTRYTPEFEEADYTIRFSSPFELNDMLTAMMKEAGVKGMAIMLQASLVDATQFYEGDTAPEGDLEYDGERE